MNDSSEINVIWIRDCDINIIKIDSLFYLFSEKAYHCVLLCKLCLPVTEKKQQINFQPTLQKLSKVPGQQKIRRVLKVNSLE